MNIEEYHDNYDNELVKVDLMEKYIKQHLECFTYLSKLYISFVDEFIDNDNNFIQLIEDLRNILDLIDNSMDIDIIINKNKVLQYVKDIHKCYLDNDKSCK